MKTTKTKFNSIHLKKLVAQKKCFSEKYPKKILKSLHLIPYFIKCIKFDLGFLNTLNYKKWGL